MGVGSGRVVLGVKFALHGASSSGEGHFLQASQPEMPELQTHMVNTQATPLFCRERLGKEIDRARWR